MAVETTLTTVRDSIRTFNEYLGARAELSNRKPDHEKEDVRGTETMLFEDESSLRIDIEGVEKRAEMPAQVIITTWVKNAKLRGAAAILRETGKHQDFIWEHFQKGVGLKF